MAKLLLLVVVVVVVVVALLSTPASAEMKQYEVDFYTSTDCSLGTKVIAPRGDFSLAVVQSVSRLSATNTSVRMFDVTLGVADALADYSCCSDSPQIPDLFVVKSGSANGGGTVVVQQTIPESVANFACMQLGGEFHDDAGLVHEVQFYVSRQANNQLTNTRVHSWKGNLLAPAPTPSRTDVDAAAVVDRVVDSIDDANNNNNNDNNNNDDDDDEIDIVADAFVLERASAIDAAVGRHRHQRGRGHAKRQAMPNQQDRGVAYFAGVDDGNASCTGYAYPMYSGKPSTPHFERARFNVSSDAIMAVSTTGITVFYSIVRATASVFRRSTSHTPAFVRFDGGGAVLDQWADPSVAEFAIDQCQAPLSFKNNWWGMSTSRGESLGGWSVFSPDAPPSSPPTPGPTPAPAPTPHTKTHTKNNKHTVAIAVGVSVSLVVVIVVGMVAFAFVRNKKRRGYHAI